MRRSGNSALTMIFFLTLVSFGFGLMVWLNTDQSAPTGRVIVPTNPLPTDVANAWQDVLRSGITGNNTPIPTVAIPDQQYIPPTIVRDLSQSPTPFDVNSGNLGQGANFAAGVTPTLPPATATLIPFGTEVRVLDVPTVTVRATSYPSYEVPLSLDMLGWDHYWFARPVSADAVNFGLPYYEYGTDGSPDAPLRIHTGIDIPNPKGTTIRAAADGIVNFATDADNPVFQNSVSYGKVVVIDHIQYGFNGQPVFTLYAHLEAVLVSEGDVVKKGDPIALMGDTGHTTGPHVHFEIRMGENSYGSTYNPVLWLAPYVGRGTIAGRVVGERGEFLDDVTVTLISGGLVLDTTTTYVFRGSGSEVNPDPNWRENFVFPDVQEGRYEVSAVINGERIARVIDVRAGMTTGVELTPRVVGEVQQGTPIPLP